MGLTPLPMFSSSFINPGKIGTWTEGRIRVTAFLQLTPLLKGAAVQLPCEKQNLVLLRTVPLLARRGHCLFVLRQTNNSQTLRHLGRGMAARVSPSHLGSVTTVVTAAPPSMPDECH